ADLQGRLNCLADRRFAVYQFGPDSEIVCARGCSSIRRSWRPHRFFAVNGKALPANEPLPLRHGDALRFYHEAEFNDPPDEASLPPGADGLFRAVLESPADQRLRLILADWLEEQGRPQTHARAEFIRLQVDLERDPPFAEAADDPRCERAAALRAEYDAAWAGPVVMGLANAWEYRRGFVEAVRLDAEALGLHAD